MVMPDINPSVSKHEKSLQIPLAQNWRMAMIPTFQVVIKHQDDQLEEICDSSTELWPYDFREKNGNSSQPCVSTKGSVVLTPFFLAIYIYTSGRPYLPHPPSSCPIRKAHRVTPGQTIVTPGFKSPRHSGSDASCFEVVANFESCP